MAASFFNRTVPVVNVLGFGWVSVRLKLKIDPDICLVELVNYEVTGMADLDADVPVIGKCGAAFRVDVTQVVTTERCDAPPDTCKKTLKVQMSVFKIVSFCGTQWSSWLADVDAEFRTSCLSQCCAEG